MSTEICDVWPLLAPFMLTSKGTNEFKFDAFSVGIYKSSYVSSLYKGLNVVRGSLVNY